MSDPSQTIQFIRSSIPPITPGQYTLTVQQEITELDAGGDPRVKGLPKFYPVVTKTVHIQGERFSIDPRDIDSVFPPEGGGGDYGNENLLPYITFSRKTLPWEQNSGVANAPWLALLVFHEKDEGGIPQVVPSMVGDLLRNEFRPGESAALAKRKSTLVTKERDSKQVIATYPDAAKGIPWEKRLGENDWDPCLIVDVPVRLMHEIAPTKDDLPWLAHSRVVSSASETREFSAIIANRLPLREGISMACLVSLEQMLDFLPPASGIQANRQNATHVRLVVMKAWSFRCGADLRGFYHALSTGPLALPYTKPDSETPEDAKVKNALAMGYTPLDHNTRWGDRAISWYRGPFLPFSSKVTRSIPLPPICEEGYVTGTAPLSSADEALRYDPELGMLDVSYAAAWQLGRLMALRDETFAHDLYRWKRENKRKIVEPQTADVFALLAEMIMSVAQKMNPTQSARNLVDDPDKLKKHLAGARAPESVVNRLATLRRLEGVPIDYLVPDERMLPPESLRFFQVDLNWVYSLVEGAYSIARVSTGDKKQDAATCPHDVYRQISGFLLRSAIVSGWPTLQAQVKVSNPSATYRELRCQRITPDILLYLVEVEGQGVITSVTLQVPPENIEFHVPKSATFRDPGRSVVDIHTLAQGENTAAEFAVMLALKPIVTPDFVVDKSTVYPGEKVKISCDNVQEGVWYGISVSSEGGPSPPPPGFSKGGRTFGYETAPILTNSTIQVFAELPFNVRRRLIRTIPVTVSRSVPPDDSQEVKLVNTMYGGLLPNEFYLGRVPIIRIRGSQKGVTYQLLVDGIKVGIPVPGGDPERGAGLDAGLDVNAIELKRDTTFVVRAARSTDPNVFADLKQSVAVIAIPDIDLGVTHATTPIESGSETRVLVSPSQIGVTYTLVAGASSAAETKKKTMSSAVGTGTALELPTGRMTETSYFHVTAKLPGSRLVQLRQDGLIWVKDSPLVN